MAILTDSKLFSVDACEDVVKQFKEFSSDHAANPDFLSFEVGSSHLDIILCNSMGINKKYSVLWTFAKKLLLLSHGQASVERGFSLNKEIMVDNMLPYSDSTENNSGLFKICWWCTECYYYKRSFDFCLSSQTEICSIFEAASFKVRRKSESRKVSVVLSRG